MAEFAKIIKYVFDRKYRVIINAWKGKYKNIPDEEYLKKIFFANLGYKLDLLNPKTFNEKMQWLKLHDHNPLYEIIVDKYECKEYLRSYIDEKHIVPTLKLYNSIEEINIDELPNQFVIKSTHDSGTVFICKDKATFDLDIVKQELSKKLKTNYYYSSREWPYKGVKPRIISEEYLSMLDGEQVPEHKIFCFNGVAKYDLVCVGKAHSGDRTNTFYDMSYNIIPVDSVFKRASAPIKKPTYFDDMIALSEKVSQIAPFLRVDFYCFPEQFFVGELTLYHNAGFCKFSPKSYDEFFGNQLTLEV